MPQAEHEQLLADARALAHDGRIEDAIALSRNALERCPGYVEAMFFMAQLKTFRQGDPDLAALQALAQDEGVRSKPELSLLLFALAKAYEDFGDHERSFTVLLRANALKRATLSPDIDTYTRYLRRIADVFNEGLFDRFADAGSCSELPILIVGMPRSGTTLVEQILASHRDVSGAGELPDLQELTVALSLLTGGSTAFPEAVAHVTPEELTRIGNGYAARLRSFGSDSKRVTDKSGWNFRYLGLARVIVPAARVVHCVRDPVETCLSCFRNSFDGEEFTYDLSELGRYYNAYAQLMDHWRRVLPAGWMLEVRYEELVSDFEGEVRRILTHCGLEWDETCRAFHTTRRPVRTASLVQVRRPLYNTSVARSRNYQHHLQPLIDALQLDEAATGFAESSSA